MKCQFCENPATVHLTDIINKKKREMHLCESCAQKNQLISETKQELNIPALLHFLIQQTFGVASKDEANEVICPICGLKYAQFRTKGRFGCPGDYAIFHDSLVPLLERIHRNTKHIGKIPSRFRRARFEAEKLELQNQLKQAIAEERYEEAARLRDLVRAREAADESR
jgi:protein arginine kinase activator